MHNFSIKEQFLGALAFAGDLTMGQPPEHSPKTAILASKIAQMAGQDEEVCMLAAQLGMIRWAGCTANADGFSDLFGNDIRGRREFLAGRNPFTEKKPPSEPFHDVIMPLVNSHCDVAAIIAIRGNFAPALVDAIRDIFEFWDGSGWPRGASGTEINPCTQYVWLANDLEVFSRIYGHELMCQMVMDRAGTVYEKNLAFNATEPAENWLKEIHHPAVLEQAFDKCYLHQENTPFDKPEAIRLLADFSDLKRPEFTGMARTASNFAGAMARGLGLQRDVVDVIEQAAMLCGLGFVSVPNAAFDRNDQADVESLRLVPYWTERILSRAPDLAHVARIASMAFERLDGTGWHRELSANALTIEARIVQVAVVIAQSIVSTASTSSRLELISRLEKERDLGKLDSTVINGALYQLGVDSQPMEGLSTDIFDVTTRAREVLAFLIRGQTNKEIARRLDISPKTVGTHLENLYRKFGVTTRAAAAIKALEAGLI